MNADVILAFVAGFNEILAADRANEIYVLDSASVRRK